MGAVVRRLLKSKDVLEKITAALLDQNNSTKPWLQRPWPLTKPGRNSFNQSVMEQHTCTKQVSSHTGKHGHRKQTAGSKMSRAGSDRTETSTLPLPWQHQSDTGRQAAAGRTRGMGWGRECRIGEMVEVALAGRTGSEIFVVALLKEFQRVQSGPEGNFYPERDDKGGRVGRGESQRGGTSKQNTQRS